MFETAVQAGQRAFPPGNPYGVHAIGVATRRVNGLTTKDPVVRVKVAARGDQSSAPIPHIRFSFRGRNYQMRPDVVGCSAPARAHLGRTVPYTGLHEGGMISSVLSTGETVSSAVGFMLCADNGDLFVLTCGHGLDPGVGWPVFAAGPGESAAEIGWVAANLLDDTEDPIDVAAIALGDYGVDLLMNTEPTLAPAQPTTGHHNGQERALAYLPGARDLSFEVTARLGWNVVYLWCEERESYLVLNNCYQVDGLHTSAGDSGTPLVSSTTAQRALGLCAGGDSQTTWFEPLGRCLPLLEERLGRSLGLLGG